MIKLTDLIPGSPWSQEEVVQEQTNPVVSGYGTLSPCRSTGPLYQQVLTPQVPTETEMGTLLGELLTSMHECPKRGLLTAGFIHRRVTLPYFFSMAVYVNFYHAQYDQSKLL